MKKRVFKITAFILISLLVIMCFGCKKKEPKHKWIEVGSDPNPVKMAPGVHPERGTISDAINIILAPIYYPVGRDKNGDPQYKKYLYEMETLTPEGIDEAFKQIGLIDEASLFCDLVIEDADESVLAGPGAAKGSELTKKGTVRYVDLSTSIDNSDNYADKTRARDLEGMIDMDDILHCITQTFEENFQLVSCDIEPVGMEVYNEVHKK